MRIGERIREIEHDERLDPAVLRLRRLADHLPSGPVRDLLHGVPLGHPAHPTLVHLPMGTWLAAVVLDALPGDHRRGAHALVNIGLLASLPAVVTGLADWSEQHGRQQRVGAAHAAANGAGALMFAASSVARTLGRQGWGRALALAGMSAVGIGGTLGGHLTYYRSGGVNRADHLLDLVPEGWHDLGPLDGFPEDDTGQGDVDGVPVVVARTNGSVRALLGTCPHLGAPLGEGELVEGCVRCPWHGSEFRLDSGTVVHGPATASLEPLETSVVDGRLMVRLRSFGG
ncbi:Rieske 2Fe-2S domain-containing protein [Nocardiopsis exhalans]|uniref:Rieske 2Fe-2S domain-containing protein n=1 Tax=Nocardiopsis exhalans TaxID=163604 RepID=A0ABY5DFX0_9ACTN|nr:Rieske 2Fe-2S domain-containing protein [Nocardiopsis exhalans]USY22845.1 Rieske 2Fe-2S domain-containing protein [Nocardiopsis exhalans]